MAKRVLMVIAEDQFRDEELFVPREAFTAEGWQVDTVSTKTGAISGMLGGSETVTQTLADVTPADYDVAVVVGGMGSPQYLWNNPQLHACLHTIEKAGKVVSAICLSGAVLANAGLLVGKKATVWEMPESVAALEKGGATFTGEPVTVDGRIITANGPEAASDFAKAIIAQVKALVPTGA